MRTVRWRIRWLCELASRYPAIGSFTPSEASVWLAGKLAVMALTLASLGLATGCSSKRADGQINQPGKMHAAISGESGSSSECFPIFASPGVPWGASADHPEGVWNLHDGVTVSQAVSSAQSKGYTTSTAASGFPIGGCWFWRAAAEGWGPGHYPDEFKCDGQCDDLIDVPDTEWHDPDCNCTCPSASCFVSCPANSSACNDGACISDSQICDGITDCAGGEDEERCALAFYYPCDPGMEECNDGTCIYESQVCDGIADCAGGEDELCHPPCPEGQTACNDGVCIFESSLCDGTVDCAGGEDEFNCVSCGEGSVPCADGACISYSQICDGVADCRGGEDEGARAGCAPCGVTEVACNQVPSLDFPWDYGNCIPASSVCNGIADCINGEDEAACSPCGDGSQCPNGTCISDDKFCDGRADCPDGADEGCVLECPSGDKEFEK